MQVTTVLSGWDTALLIVPFAALMAMAMFGLDERLASPTATRPRNRRFCGIDRDGQAVLSDPDGRRWYAGGSKKRPSSVVKMTLKPLRLERETSARASKN